MKKSTKIILLTATGLVAFGIVLTAAGVIAGASFREIYHGGLWDNVYYEEEYDNSFKSSGVYEVDSEDIDKISIDWVSGDIDIVPYDGDNIVMEETARKEITDENCLRYRVKDGELSINYTTGKVAVKFGNTGDDINKRLQVKVPEELAGSLKSLSVDSVSSDITADGFAIDSMYVEVTSGNTRLSDMKVKHFEIDMISGDLEAAFTECPEELDVDSTSGDSTVYLPAGSGFTLEFDGVSGEFITEFSPLRNSDDDYVVGNGKNSFSVDTTGGDFTVKIARTAKI